MKKEKNILIFGGTFNPIHNGHLIVARAAMENSETPFDFCFLLPNGKPPHKLDIASPQARLKMCQLATDGDKKFVVKEYESLKKEPSYTIETVAHFEELIGATVWWLIGPDNLWDIRNWYRFKDFPGNVRFVVGLCGELSLSEKDMIAEYEKMGIELSVVGVPNISIRSTGIRQRVAKRLPIRYLVPDKVADFIREYRLYECLTD